MSSTRDQNQTSSEDQRSQFLRNSKYTFRSSLRKFKKSTKTNNDTYITPKNSNHISQTQNSNYQQIQQGSNSNHSSNFKNYPTGFSTFYNENQLQYVKDSFKNLQIEQKNVQITNLRLARSQKERDRRILNYDQTNFRNFKPFSANASNNNNVTINNSKNSNSNSGSLNLKNLITKTKEKLSSKSKNNLNDNEITATDSSKLMPVLNPLQNFENISHYYHQIDHLQTNPNKPAPNNILRTHSVGANLVPPQLENRNYDWNKTLQGKTRGPEEDKNHFRNYMESEYSNYRKVQNLGSRNHNDRVSIYATLTQPRSAARKNRSSQFTSSHSRISNITSNSKNPISQQVSNSDKLNNNHNNNKRLSPTSNTYSYQLSPKSAGSYELFNRYKTDLEVTFTYLDKILQKNLEDNFLDICDILLEQVSKFFNHLSGVLQSQKRCVESHFGTDGKNCKRDYYLDMLQLDSSRSTLSTLKNTVCTRVGALSSSLDQAILNKYLSNNSEISNLSANLLPILQDLKQDIKKIYHVVIKIMGEIKEMSRNKGQTLKNFVSTDNLEINNLSDSQNYEECKLYYDSDYEVVPRGSLNKLNYEKNLPPPSITKMERDQIFERAYENFARQSQNSLENTVSQSPRSIQSNTNTINRKRNRSVEIPEISCQYAVPVNAKSSHSQNLVYDYKNEFIIDEDDGKILYATKRALIDCAIDLDNSEAAEIWVYTYRSFMSAKDCIDHLLAKLGNSNNQSDFRTRTASLLIRVVADLSPYELYNQKSLSDLLISVIHSLTNEGDITLASKLRKVFIASIKTLISFPLNNETDNNILTLKRRNRELIKSGGTKKSSEENFTGSSSTGIGSNHSLHIDDVSPIDIFDVSVDDFVNELTMIQQELFSRIEIGELLARADFPNKKDRYPRFTEFVNQFNQVSYRVNAIILLQKSKNKRNKAFSLFIEVAIKLKEMGNFNGMYCIYSALSSNSLNQLGPWGAKNKNFMNDIETLISPNCNYKIYREHISTWKGPYLPWFGAITQQLISISEMAKREKQSQNQNQNFNPDLINFKFLRQKFEAIKPWKHAARAAYTLPRNEQANKILMDFRLPIGYCSSNYENDDRYHVNSVKSRRASDIISDKSLSTTDYADFFWDLACKILRDEKG